MRGGEGGRERELQTFPLSHTFSGSSSSSSSYIVVVLVWMPGKGIRPFRRARKLYASVLEMGGFWGLFLGFLLVKPLPWSKGRGEGTMPSEQRRMRRRRRRLLDSRKHVKGKKEGGGDAASLSLKNALVLLILTVHVAKKSRGGKKDFLGNGCGERFDIYSSRIYRRGVGGGGRTV